MKRSAWFGKLQVVLSDCERDHVLPEVAGFRFIRFSCRVRFPTSHLLRSLVLHMESRWGPLMISLFAKSRLKFKGFSKRICKLAALSPIVGFPAVRGCRRVRGLRGHLGTFQSSGERLARAWGLVASRAW